MLNKCSHSAILEEFNFYMKHLIAFLVILLITGSFCLVASQQVYTSNADGYSLELPSTEWRAISEGDGERGHSEFINGDRLQGFLQIRTEAVETETKPSDVARRDLDQKLRFLPGFVEGKQESFSGRLEGVTVSYEFVRTGKPMMGRIYYLQADNRTIYALRFTGLRDKLARIRNQTDFIARSFKLKQ